MNPKKIVIIVMLTVIMGAGAGSIFYTMYRLRNHQEFLSDRAPDIKRIEKAKGETITLTETKAGHRKWVLKMKEIKYSKDNSTAKLVGIQGLVYGENQDVLFTFEAPDGVFFKETNRIILNNGAKMFSPAAKVLISANRMEWSSDSKNIRADGGVRMTKQDFGTSKSQRASFAMDFSQIQFLGDATSVLGGHTNTGD